MVRQWILLLCLLLPLTVVARDVVSEETVGATKKDRPIPKHQWNYLTKLWLGRSCVGEAGFDAVDECVGIAWTMATRAREYHTTFLRIVQSYSLRWGETSELAGEVELEASQEAMAKDTRYPRPLGER